MGTWGGGRGDDPCHAAAGLRCSQHEQQVPDKPCISLLPACRAPRDTAAALLRELNELDRIQLVLALKGALRDRYQEKTETQYVEDISKQISLSGNQQHRKLTKQQIQDAVRFQRQLGRQGGLEQPPTWRQLLAVGAASGLPFIAFGFLDNGIMVGPPPPCCTAPP